MRFYVADANASASEIDVIDKESPTGGYALKARYDLGTVYGPGQIAIALISDAVGDEMAKKHYQEFQYRVLSRLEGKAWELSQEDIRQEVMDIERTQGGRTWQTR